MQVENFCDSLNKETNTISAGSSALSLMWNTFAKGFHSLFSTVAYKYYS